MKEQNRRQRTLSTYIVMFCTLLSRILGFVRTALISALFGASGTADVLNSVFNIPNNFRKLLAEGALSSAFIPEFSALLVSDKSGQKAKELNRSIFALLLAILIPITALSVFMPGTFVKIFIHFKDPQKMEMAADLFRWVFSYLFLVSISALLMAVLNSHNKFFIPAMTPLIFSISVISSLLIFHKNLGGYAFVIGILVGGLGQIAFQLFTYRNLGYRLRPKFNFNSESFRKVMKRWLPILIASSIAVINQTIAGFLATTLRDGSVSAVTNAIVFWQLPFGLFSASITTVYYPQMSRLVARNDIEGLTLNIISGYKALVTFLLPSALILMLLNSEVVSMAFQRGDKFTWEHSVYAGRVLFAYCTGMVFVALYQFTQRVFYALGDYKTPIICAASIVSLDIVLSLLLIYVFKMDAIALAYANSIAFFIGFFVLLFILKRKVGSINVKPLFVTIIKVVLAVVVASVAVLFVERYIPEGWATDGSSFKGLIYLAILGITFVIAVVAIFVLTKVEALSILRKKSEGEKIEKENI